MCLWILWEIRIKRRYGLISFYHHLSSQSLTTLFTIPRKQTCPLKNSAWKTIFLLKNGHFLGDILVFWAVYTSSSRWFHQPIWKNIRKIGSSPQVGVKIESVLKLPPSHSNFKLNIEHLLTLQIAGQSADSPPWSGVAVQPGRGWPEHNGGGISNEIHLLIHEIHASLMVHLGKYALLNGIFTYPPGN